MTEDQQVHIRETAHAMAEAARRAVLPFFRASGLEARNKGDKTFDGGFDPVTEADREAEAVMREILASERPGDAIIGEEFGVTPGSSGLTWVLDPIDGTRGFIAGTPTWGVLIAVSNAGGPVFGMIDQPYIGERFWGGFGTVEMDGPQGRQPICVRGNRPLDEALLFTTFPEVGSAAERRGFEEVSRRVKLTRYGMDCYAYALVGRRPDRPGNRGRPVELRHPGADRGDRGGGRDRDRLAGRCRA